MKKNILLLTAIATTITLASCSGGGEKKADDTAIKEEAKTEKKDMAEEAMWSVKADKSTVKWTGGTAGAQVYSHYGTIAIQSGKLMTKGESIQGGEFVIDMSTIAPKDENYGEDNPKEKLVDHLSSDDFFAVKKHPTAMFKVKSADGNKITGDLTVRGKTHEETIQIESMEMNNGMMTAKGKLVFDRQNYDVAWEHYMEDVVLSDDIELNIELTAKKS